MPAGAGRALIRLKDSPGTAGARGERGPGSGAWVAAGAVSGPVAGAAAQVSDQWSASTSRAWRRSGSSSGTASPIRSESSRRISSNDLLMRKQGVGAREVSAEREI